jgi:hypothetical protein
LDVVAIPAATTGMTCFLIRRLVPLRYVDIFGVLWTTTMQREIPEEPKRPTLSMPLSSPT